MKLWKLTVAFAFTAFALTSCKKDQNLIERSNPNITMTGAQVAPMQSQSAAIGNINATYTSKTKLLDYRMSWSGLSGNVTAIHLHGPSDRLFAGPIIQTLSGFPTSATNSFNATLFVDGVKVTEAELLSGKYYVDIHTAGTYSATGEIRGQIEF